MRDVLIFLSVLLPFVTPDASRADTITSVVFSGDLATNPSITITGTGFGDTPPTPTSSATPDTFTGFDFGTDFYFTDAGAHTFQAGNGYNGNWIGLVILSYSDTSVTFQFGSNYTVDSGYGEYQVDLGDPFDVVLDGASFGGTVSEAPEPSSLLLLSTGILGVCGGVRKRQLTRERHRQQVELRPLLTGTGIELQAI